MGSRKKVAYVVSHIERSKAFEWTARALSERFDFLLIVLNPVESSMERLLRKEGIAVVSIPYRYKLGLLRVIFSLVNILRQQRPAVVHCHLLDASMAGLFASWLVGIPHRIYTRHTSTFHHAYAKGGVRYDKLCNRLSTRIVSISQATDHVLMSLEGVSPEKIIRIPHGFRFEEFAKPGAERMELVKARWGISDRSPRIGVVARHIEWKGVGYIIMAFKKFLVAYPEAVLILANSVGPDHDQVVTLLNGIPAENVVQISFEEDLVTLFHQFDMYIHTPVDRYCEAFGQTYIEALACSIPSIFTRSGIADEFVEDKIHALVVVYKDSDAIAAAMELLWRDSSLRDRLSSNGKMYVEQHFGFQQMIDKLVGLYNE